jgi:hypothetical protein
MIREASIILPRVHKEATFSLREGLLDRFGGYTEHEADGAWRDPQTGIVHIDYNSVFTIAVDDDDGSHMLDLRDLAMNAGTQAGQISVYVRGFDGHVEFVNCDHMPAPALVTHGEPIHA